MLGTLAAVVPREKPQTDPGPGGSDAVGAEARSAPQLATAIGSGSDYGTCRDNHRPATGAWGNPFVAHSSWPWIWGLPDAGFPCGAMAWMYANSEGPPAPGGHAGRPCPFQAETNRFDIVVNSHAYFANKSVKGG